MIAEIGKKLQQDVIAMIEAALVSYMRNVPEAIPLPLEGH